MWPAYKCLREAKTIVWSENSQIFKCLTEITTNHKIHSCFWMSVYKKHFLNANWHKFNYFLTDNREKKKYWLYFFHSLQHHLLHLDKIIDGRGLACGLLVNYLGKQRRVYRLKTSKCYILDRNKSKFQNLGLPLNEHLERKKWVTAKWHFLPVADKLRLKKLDKFTVTSQGSTHVALDHQPIPP